MWMILAGLGVIAGAVGFSKYGWDGVAAAAVVAAVFAVYGAGSQVLREWLTNRPPIVALGVSMLVRDGLALTLAVIWLQSDTPLTRAGIVMQLLMFYLVTLTVETVLAVRQLRGASLSAVNGRAESTHG